MIKKVYNFTEKRGNFGKGAKKVFIPLFVVLLLFVILFIGYLGVYTVKETEIAVITTFGQAQMVEEKGLHFKIPFMQKVKKVDTTVKGIPIGYAAVSRSGNNEINEKSSGYSGAITSVSEEVEESYEEVAVEKESLMITSDFNLINVDFYISYQVSDPIKYLYSSKNPEAILKDISMASIRTVVSAYTVDSTITTGKAGIQSTVKAMIIERLEETDIGITLVDAAIQDVEPPIESVNDAFKNVETAKQGKESAINEANAYRNQKIPAAEAEADKIMQDAEAKKVSRINEANGQVAKFNAEYEEYIKYPLITKQRMFYETMSELLPHLKIFIENGNGDVLKHISLDSLSGSISGNE